MAQSPLFRQVRQWVQEEIARRQRDVGVIGNSINGGNVVGNSDANARVGVRKNSAGDTYLRRRLNLIEGSNITATLADDDTDEEVDVTLEVDDPLVQAIVRAASAAGLRLEDKDGNLGLFVEDGGNTRIGSQLYFGANVGDIISLYSNRLGSSNMYGFGVETSGGQIYYKGAFGHHWYVGDNADQGTSAAMKLDDSHLTPNVGLGESWNAVSFNTGWGNLGSAAETVGYRKFGDTVRFKGIASRSSGSAGTLFTLPAAYRPANSQTFAVATSDLAGTYAFGYIEIQSDGDVILQAGQVEGVSLGGIELAI